MPLTQIPIDKANRLINHGPTILVTANLEDKQNVMTAAWCMPASHTPPMLAVAVGPTRYSHDMIIKSGEFAVNIPALDILKQTWCCGTHTGKNEDKFTHCGLTPIKGDHVKAPLIEECIGAIECRLVSHPTAGDHTILIGEVVAAWARPEAFEDRLKVETVKTLHHLGGRQFCLPGEVVSS